MQQVRRPELRLDRNGKTWRRMQKRSTTPEEVSVLVTCPVQNCICCVTQCHMIVICYHLILAESLCTPSPQKWCKSHCCRSMQSNGGGPPRPPPSAARAAIIDPFSDRHSFNEVTKGVESTVFGPCSSSQESAATGALLSLQGGMDGAGDDAHSAEERPAKRQKRKSDGSTKPGPGDGARDLQEARPCSWPGDRLLPFGHVPCGFWPRSAGSPSACDKRYPTEWGTTIRATNGNGCRVQSAAICIAQVLFCYRYRY